MQACCVCAGDAPKYRCPGCRVRYCSVSCCKKHKEECSPTAALDVINTTSPAGREVKALSTKDCLLEEDSESDRVPEQKLQLLGESEELKGLLLNPHLRHLLTSLDQSAEREAAVKKCMQEPLFVEFADKCLSIVEPDDTHNGYPKGHN